MHGLVPSIPDIVLGEIEPEPVHLLCDEELQEEEVEHRDKFKVYLSCGTCGQKLVLFLLGTEECVRVFQQLLLANLDILCGTCGRNNNGSK